MVSTVTAPFDGIVTSLAVSNNTQVERGAPLCCASRPPTAPRPRTTLAMVPSRSRVSTSPAWRPRTAIRRARTPGGSTPTWVTTCSATTWTLTASRVCSSGRPPSPPSFRATTPSSSPPRTPCSTCSATSARSTARVEDEAENGREETSVDNTQEYFLAYLQWLDPDQAGLPERYRKRLSAALARYGVAGLTRSKALEAATVWLYRAFARIPEVAPAIVAILNRRLAQHDQLADMTTLDARARLDRLVRATEGRQQNVADLARDILFHFFDEPKMLAGAADVQAQDARRTSTPCATTPRGPERAARIDALVCSPHPVRSRPARRVAAHAGGRPARQGIRAMSILEVYPCRFYRMRDLRDFATSVVERSGSPAPTTTMLGMPVHLVVAYLPLEQLRVVRRRPARIPGGRTGRRVRSSSTSWSGARGPCPISTTLVETWQTDISRVRLRPPAAPARPHRDRPGRRRRRAAAPSTSPSARARTAASSRTCCTATSTRCSASGSTCGGCRTSPWSGCPRPRTSTSSSESRTTTPRTGVCSPSQRSAISSPCVTSRPASRPTRGWVGSACRPWRRCAPRWRTIRPASGRRPTGSSSSVRPTWKIPAEEMAGAGEPTTCRWRRGRAWRSSSCTCVKVPTRGHGGTALVEKVITVEGIGRSGTTIRFGDPGAHPIRPLTRYAQKVLTAERFGTPYPYEIIQMLTPAEGEPSPFPRGHFQELDLDSAATPSSPSTAPAGNTAHLVVGLHDELHRCRARRA